MSLAPGGRLGPYEILGPLGAGGMGEVWRARDPRLGRDVAIKALPALFAQDPERLARFEREAKLLASLSHPNIAGIHGLEEVEGHRYLVLEYVEGETLAARLARGPLPVSEAIEVCREVAAGLEAAHESGVVHRDLKPGNVMLTPSGGVKVLDFGLAKSGAAAGSGSQPGLADSPTLTASPTLAGVILGTAAYMSPEQARGRVVDRRTDIWSFGCVLYECLAGRQLFQGETVSDLIAKILEREPDWSPLPAETPARVRELLRRCLAKDARNRLRDMGDARLELAEAAGGEPEAQARPARKRSGRREIALALLAALASVTAVKLYDRFAARPPAPVLRKFVIPVAQLSAGFTSPPRITADGRRIVYRDRDRLWVRDLGGFEANEVPGSQGAEFPFWSPDGTRLGYIKDRKIWARPLSGGQSALICTLPGVVGCNHATWGENGDIVFAMFRGGLYQVSARGGEPRVLVEPDSSEVDFHHPQFLPGGRQVIAIAHRKAGPQVVAVVSVSDGRRKTLRGFDGLTSAVYSPTGHLLLNFDVGRQRILAVPFSATKADYTGESFVVAPGGLYPTVSGDGTLVFCRGSSITQRELAWVDHQGRFQEVVGQPQRGLDLIALSPDGRRVATVGYENDNADIWIQDLARGTRSRLVAGPQDDVSPSWSPDGSRIYYGEQGNVTTTLMEVAVDGTRAPRQLAEGWFPSCTPDGRTLVFNREQGGNQTLWRLDLSRGEVARPERLVPGSTAQEDEPRVSPDGRWIAYISDESGQYEVFVRRYPAGPEKQQVSLKGGSWPFWSPRGDVLYYWEGGELMEAPVGRGDRLEIGEARALFSQADVGIAPSDFEGRPPVDAAADGRFLAVRRWSGDPLNGLLVVENWLEEFRKR